MKSSEEADILYCGKEEPGSGDRKGKTHLTAHLENKRASQFPQEVTLIKKIHVNN